MRVSVSMHPHQYLLLSIFFIITILESVKGYIIVVLIYVSIMTNYAERFFLCLLTICVSSLMVCTQLPSLKIRLFVFLLLG